MCIRDRICNMREGYRPTIQDKNRHADFVSFIQQLIDFGNKSSRITIIPKDGAQSVKIVFEETEFGYEFKVCLLYTSTYYCTETQSADTTITLTDSDGSALFTVTPEKAYASIVLTCPEMKLDATYTLAAGTDNEEITLTDIITTAGTRSVKTMSDPEGGKMPNNSDNKGTPPSKPSDTAE